MKKTKRKFIKELNKWEITQTIKKKDLML